MTWRPFETTGGPGGCRLSQSVALVLMTAISGAAATACGAAGNPDVDVLAASSFTDVAGSLETLLEAELDIDVRFSFGSSGSFLEQIKQGAPAGVVITADTETMSRIEGAGLVEPSAAITRNELVIVTADTDAGRSVTSLADLASDAVVVVVCSASAPCGTATDRLLAAGDVELSPASREPNVRATLTKVLLGEADAAIVYQSDAVAHPDLRSVEVGLGNVGVVGRVAVVPDQSSPDQSSPDQSSPDRATVDARVVEVLTGERAAVLFDEAGFGTP